MENLPLTPKQERFCHEYVNGINALNGTRSAIAAGYATSGAAVEASRLLGNPKIQGRVADLQAKRTERIEIKGDDILKELMKIAMADVRKVFMPDGSMRPMDEWPWEIAACIKSVEIFEELRGLTRRVQKDDTSDRLPEDEPFEDVTRGINDTKVVVGYVKKVSFWPKDKALEILAKHTGLLRETPLVNLNMPVMIVDDTATAMETVISDTVEAAPEGAENGSPTP